LFNANHESNNTPSEPPQINRLGPSVGLVTMTMGGNNLGRNGQGLGDLLQYCYLHHSACHQDLHAGVTNQLHAIDGTRHDNTNQYNLELVYEMLRRDAPNARILVAGYPHEFTGTYNGSCERIDQTDQVWMNQVVDSLNSVIKANIQAANKAFGARIEYVDPIPWFTGHALDNGSSCSWVGQAFNSTSITTVSHRDGWFHPNVLGQNLYARAFMKELRKPAPNPNPGPTTPSVTPITTPSPSSSPSASCHSRTFQSVVTAKYGPGPSASGQPTCDDGYALQVFTPYSGGQAAQFFFKQSPTGTWTIIEGGDSIPTIACQMIPPSVLTKLGALCPPAAYAPTAPPSPTTSTTS
jgi:hypothetical protein